MQYRLPRYLVEGRVAEAPQRQPSFGIVVGVPYLSRTSRETQHTVGKRYTVTAHASTSQTTSPTRENLYYSLE